MLTSAGRWPAPRVVTTLREWLVIAGSTIGVLLVALELCLVRVDGDKTQNSVYLRLKSVNLDPSIVSTNPWIITLCIVATYHITRPD